MYALGAHFSAGITQKRIMRFSEDFVKIVRFEIHGHRRSHRGVLTAVTLRIDPRDPQCTNNQMFTPKVVMAMMS